jgi:hypothetical protein
MLSSFNHSRDDEEEGSYSEEIDRPSINEIKAAAQLIVQIEESVRLDMRWLRVRVVDGFVRVHGSVESLEERSELEAVLRRNPAVRDLEMHVSIRDRSIDD